MKPIVLILAFASLAGCLSHGDDAPSSQASPTMQPAPEVNDSLPQDPATVAESIAPRVTNVTAGSIELQGMEPLAPGSISSGEFNASFQALPDGSVSIGFLQPNTPYTLQVDDWSQTVTTTSLNWTWAPDDSAPLQPGVSIHFESEACTLGVLLRDASYSRLYGVAAGHCGDQVGDKVYLEHGGDRFEVGEMVIQTYSDGQDDLYGLYALDASHYDKANPAIRGISGPSHTGSVYDDLDEGDRLCFHGQGMEVPGPMPETFMPRCGELANVNRDPAPQFSVKGHATQGDSGSALIADDGSWQGIITSGIQFDTFWASPACSILKHTESIGYNLALATAPYQDYEPPPYSPPGAGVLTVALGALGSGDLGSCPDV